MPNERYEDEIRELLNRMDNFIPEDGKPKRPQRAQPSPWSSWLSGLRQQLYGYSSNSLLVGWVMLALAAGLLRKIYPPLGLLAALLSVACLLGAILIPMLSRQHGRPQQRWRGRVIDLRQPAQLRQPFSWRYVWWRIKNFFGFR